MSRNDVVLRRYNENDIDEIIEVCCRVIPQLPHYYGRKVEPERLRFLLENSARDESAFMVNVLVSPEGKIVGGVCGYCVTELMSWEKTTGDIFLYVEPEWRSMQNVLRLIRAYVAWGLRRGAYTISATHTAGYRSEAMDVLLRRAGMEYIGNLYHYKHKDR